MKEGGSDEEGKGEDSDEYESEYDDEDNS